MIMTREEAREAAEVMLAYADGKKMEYKSRGSDKWEEIEDFALPNFNWNNYEYRIKPEPTYRPFKDKEECWTEMQKHQPFGWLYEMLSTAYVNINGIDSLCVCCDEDAHEYCKAFEKFTFADGTPFGIKVKE